MNIQFFDNKIEKFISSFEKPTIAKVLRALDLLETFGNRLGMPHSKPMKNGLFELRVRGVQEVRMIYAFHKQGIVLLNAFLKKTDRIPSKEIVEAESKKRMLDKK